MKKLYLKSIISSLVQNVAVYNKGFISLLFRGCVYYST